MLNADNISKEKSIKDISRKPSSVPIRYRAVSRCVDSLYTIRENQEIHGISKYKCMGQIYSFSTIKLCRIMKLHPCYVLPNSYKFGVYEYDGYIKYDNSLKSIKPNNTIRSKVY